MSAPRVVALTGETRKDTCRTFAFTQSESSNLNYCCDRRPFTTNNNPASGLSSGATIAIAVLATVVGLMLAFLAWFLWYRGRRNSQQQKNQALLIAAAATPGSQPVPLVEQQQQYPIPTGPPAPLGTVAAVQQPPMDPSPPAYVPHPRTQELHAQGEPSVLVIQQYGSGGGGGGGGPTELELDGAGQAQDAPGGREECA